VARHSGGDENDSAASLAVAEATGRVRDDSHRGLAEDQVVVLASGNLGLVYLMEEPRRLFVEEIEERHPRLVDDLRRHPHIGFLLVHSREHGATVMGANGTHYLDDGRVIGQDPLAGFPANAAAHLRRTDSFKHAPDIAINSFYDPELERGCAFEELISFHGGLGGPQTRPFILYPVELAVPSEPIVGAVGVHDLLTRWRHSLQPAAGGGADENDVRGSAQTLKPPSHAL
jgi:hypothetical protein